MSRLLSSLLISATGNHIVALPVILRINNPHDSSSASALVNVLLGNPVRSDRVDLLNRAYPRCSMIASASTTPAILAFALIPEWAMSRTSLNLSDSST